MEKLGKARKDNNNKVCNKMSPVEIVSRGRDKTWTFTG